MNFPVTTRRPISHWILITAALLVYADGALAADHVGDPQLQAAALLTGTSAGRPHVDDDSITPHADGHQKSRIDPQEQARELIVGTSDLSRATIPPSSANSKRATQFSVSKPVYVDALKFARRMILGLAG
jgi:hypothetical protein